MRKEYFLFIAGLVIIIGTAFGHGILTDRWGKPADLSAAAKKLDAIPPVIGDWHSKPLEMPKSQLEAAEAVGHISRIYRNDKTQTEIQLLVLCGPRGPIAVHSPTICFTSAGRQQAFPEKRESVKASDATGNFWQTVFTKRTPDGLEDELDTYWAWSVQGECQAPENPRLEFAGSQHLYKIYVTHLRQPAANKTSKDSSCEDFLKVFLPAFQAALAKS